jgi:hypothetical protein
MMQKQTRKPGLLPSRDPPARDTCGYEKPPFWRDERKNADEGLNMVETVGLELGTHHPVIEPVSASRRERQFPYAEMGDRKDDLSHTETELETRRVREKPPLWRHKCD